MLSGFNHNLRHKGVLFHVQTEDTGLKTATVVTHVFVGGNVIATRRASYQKFADVDDRMEIVEAIMKEQHKEVMKDIVHGRFRGVNEALLAHGEAEPAPKAPVEPPPAAPKPIPRPTTPSTFPPRVSVAPKPPAPAPVPTLDTSGQADKTLDELILEFLSEGPQKKK